MIFIVNRVTQFCYFLFNCFRYSSSGQFCDHPRHLTIQKTHHHRRIVIKLHPFFSTFRQHFTHTILPAIGHSGTKNKTANRISMMSETDLLSTKVAADDTSITIIEAPLFSPTKSTPDHQREDMSLLSRLSVFQEYQFLRDQINTFSSNTPEGQCVAITLPNYPFFTETRLISVSVHQTGSVSIVGAARGNKGVTILEKLENLSFALSHTSFSSDGTKAAGVAITYLSE